MEKNIRKKKKKKMDICEWSRNEWKIERIRKIGENIVFLGSALSVPPHTFNRNAHTVMHIVNIAPVS